MKINSFWADKETDWIDIMQDTFIIQHSISDFKYRMEKFAKRDNKLFIDWLFSTGTDILFAIEDYNYEGY